MKDRQNLVRRHLCWGWGGLLVFLLMGLGLELLHGFKVSAYLAADQETRRFLWVLAHAHGALLSLVNIAFAVTIPAMNLDAQRLPLISLGLLAALILIPAGFFTGGLAIYQGDPGAGIAMAPLGACVLILSTAVLLRILLRGR